MLIVDSQIHLFSNEQSARATRLGQAILTLDQIVAAMDDAGVKRSYLVPVGTAANDNCLEAAALHADRFRVMAALGLNRPESRDFVRAWRLGSVAGIRLSFPPFRNPSWLRDGTADWFWPAAEELRLPVMIWAPGQHDAIAEVAVKHVGLRLTIDHLDLFVDDKDESAADIVRRDLLPLATLPNVAVKASALPCHTTEPYPFANLAPIIHEVVDAFGPDRVFWGSDLTRLRCSYQQAVSHFTQELDFGSQERLELIMGQAILKWIGW